MDTFTIGLSDMMKDMRRRGLPMSQEKLELWMEKGIITFIRVIGTGVTGRRTYFIPRKEYEAWMDENIGIQKGG